MPEHNPSVDGDVLSYLARKLVDQVALYGVAKDRAHDPRVVDAIQQTKLARAELLQELSAKIWMQDMAAIDQGTQLGAAQKAFQRLQDISGENDGAVIDEVERGEDYLRDRVEKAGQDTRLSAHTRNYLQTVLSRIERSLDDIRLLRKSL
ncbi:MAG: DUF2383 domain-containing protein [Burkholderiales bacterium]|nr:MAG: DUF2383 domain-containing protein [Burkholderiales bacterium]